MPSSENYVRDYKRESAIETPQRKRDRAQRNAARRAFTEALGHPIPPGYDVDHKQELGKGGSNRLSNLQLLPSSKNRSYARNSNGSMKSKK